MKSFDKNYYITKSDDLNFKLQIRRLASSDSYFFNDLFIKVEEDGMNFKLFTISILSKKLIIDRLSSKEINQNKLAKLNEFNDLH